jgi:hypothetical protein
VNYLHCPSGEQEWDNPNWSNQPKFAVGCGRNSTGQAHAIYAIDLNDKSYKQLVTGTELQEPYLWSGPILYNDSLGRYNDPPCGIVQAVFATKLLMFWRLYDSLEIITLGSSLCEFGLNTTMITGFKTLNMAYQGGDLLGQKISILNYILKHCSNIKLICSGLDIWWLNHYYGNTPTAVGQTKGYLYDSSHAFWPDGVTKDFKDIIRQVPIPCPDDTANCGFVGLPSSGWGPNPPPTDGSSQSISWTIADTNYQQNLATISMLADTFRNRGIHWIMINFPVSPNYKGTDWYTGSGPSPETAQDIIQNLLDIEASNRFFHFFDANIDVIHDYVYEDFSDVSHLSAQGAAKLSPKVNTIIDSILKK